MGPGCKGNAYALQRERTSLGDGRGSERPRVDGPIGSEKVPYLLGEGRGKTLSSQHGPCYSYCLGGEAHGEIKMHEIVLFQNKDGILTIRGGVVTDSKPGAAIR